MATKRKKHKNNTLVLQSYIALAVLYFTAYFLDYIYILYFLKALPVLLIAFRVRYINDKELYIQYALIISIVGDIALMFDDFFFVVGLAAFLVAHIFYAKAFSLINKKLSLITSIPFFAYSIAFLFFIVPYTADYRFPVIIYSLAIATMLWRAYLASEKNQYSSLFWGALIFAFSDTILALNRFYQEFAYAQVIVMLSYWTAQYLIFKPFEKQDD